MFGTDHASSPLIIWQLSASDVFDEVGHAWGWWESETESPSESEKNSDFQSLLSWDSSLDLDVGSWRNTEELEESSQEGDHELEFSEPLWEDDTEDYQKAESPCEDDSLLQFFSENKTGETPEELALGELHPQEISDQPQDQDDSDSTSADPTLDSRSPGNTQLVQLSWDNPLQHLLFKRTLLSIWKMIASHRYSGPFLKAVSEKQAPGYRDVVKRPMDLTSIKRRLSKGHIQSMVQFQRDLMLMFQNAMMYNSFNHHIHHMAMEMQGEVLEQLQMLGEALLCSREQLGWDRR
ncbi:PREDICTED: bromodomain-containing protein 8-like [Calidris pugnax]|uniref:bromodomain-containing protein 8-like n=1 Tax=Calidris pugnax TaxID=198806 RepID=UPI00071DE902|nr:PREDICTED: bromodomain-containing protein 8-like [Calidris pugnax]